MKLRKFITDIKLGAEVQQQGGSRSVLQQANRRDRQRGKLRRNANHFKVVRDGCQCRGNHKSRK